MPCARVQGCARSPVLSRVQQEGSEQLLLSGLHALSAVLSGQEPQAPMEQVPSLLKKQLVLKGFELLSRLQEGSVQLLLSGLHAVSAVLSA